MTNAEVTSDHLQRAAYLYVRQSTLRQVVENTESTVRQYALKNRALALGWAKDQIVVIDDDQGVSGANIQMREGFQHLVAKVGLGQVGIVMGLEVSRLARNNTDWHRLLEICALTNTLILDEDGLYDPSTFNDRLLLGLKGTMSEAELHILRARLHGGLLNKARRGELRLQLPIGLVYDDGDKVVLDPDQQIRETMATLFASFQRIGSASGVVRYFQEKELLFPRRMINGADGGKLHWSHLTYHRVLNVLHNPRYAGAFVFGKSRYRKNPATGTMQLRRLPQDQWTVFIPGAHEGYISWEQYEQIQRQLASNAAAYGLDRRGGPPREGPALLQGIAMCGRCGNRMWISYYKRSGGDERTTTYYCCRKRDETAKSICQWIPGTAVDKTIGHLLLKKVTPMSLEVAMEVFDEIRTCREKVLQFHRTQIKRARHEAELTQRRFLLVNPENRLVANELERRWNESLRTVASLEEEYARVAKKEMPELTSEEMTRLRKLTEDFPRVWNDPKTSARERKRMVRLLIEDVSLLRTDVIHVKVRFKGGAITELRIPIPSGRWLGHKTDPSVIEHIRERARTKTDNEIAAELNAQGARTGTKLPFTGRLVYQCRRNYHIAGPYEYLREKGFLTLEELAKRFGVHRRTILEWMKRGILKAHRYNDKGQALYEDPGKEIPGKWARKERRGSQSSKNVPESLGEMQYEV